MRLAFAAMFVVVALALALSALFAESVFLRMAARNPESTTDPLAASTRSDDSQLSGGSEHVFSHTIPSVIDEDCPIYQFSVPVENVTDSPVELRPLSRSCTCADAKLQKSNLAPREKTALDVSFRTLGKSGPQEVSVAFTDATQGRWQFRLKTTVLTRARFLSSEGGFAIASVDPGRTQRKDLTLELVGRNEAAVPDLMKFEASRSNVEIRAGDAKVEAIAAGLMVRRIPVTIAFESPTTAGPYQFELRARYRVGPEERVLRLPLSGFVNSIYDVSPSFIYFGEQSPEARTVSRRIEIRRCDGHPLQVGKVGVSLPSVVTALPRDSVDRDRATIELTFDPTKINKPVWGEVTVETNDVRQPMIRVRFAAMAGGTVQSQ